MGEDMNVAYGSDLAEQVSGMLDWRPVRVGQGGDHLEVRGTAQLENIDTLMDAVIALGERLDLVICYVDPAIFDATDTDDCE
jgi:hypothetical protein